MPKWAYTWINKYFKYLQYIFGGGDKHYWASKALTWEKFYQYKSNNWRMMKMLRNAKNSIGVKLQITSLNLRWASDIRKREPPSTRPNMPMGDEEMEFGSDDPLGSYHLTTIMFHYGVGTVTML